jgi:hypothetical protein
MNLAGANGAIRHSWQSSEAWQDAGVVPERKNRRGRVVTAFGDNDLRFADAGDMLSAI